MTSRNSTPHGPTCVFCGGPRDPENGPGCARCNRLRSLAEDWTAFRPTPKAARERIHWNHPDHSRFAADMHLAGLRVQHYPGRFFWQGPAVVVSDRDQAISATDVACQWDQMGLDWVFYPQAYAAARAADRLDTETGRWEPFIAIVWDGRRGDVL
jgi:hypothetical protein